MKLRIGILSTASIVPRFVGAARMLDDCTLAALASRDIDKARLKAAEWGIPLAFGSYEELMCCPDVDAVYVAVVNSMHYELAKAALEHGKHVLCEKPFTMNPGQAEELFALAREKGLFIMEMQKTVFLPVVRHLKKRIEEGALGDIVMADFSSSFDPGYNGWFFDPERGGGPLYNNAGYSLELIQYLTDSRPSKWTALSRNCETGVETSFSSVIRLENGVIVTNKTSTDASLLHTGYIYGSRGFAELPDYWKARKLTIYNKDGDPEATEIPCEYELVYELRHAIDCIKEGLTASPVMTEEITVSTVRVISGLHDMIFEKRK